MRTKLAFLLFTMTLLFSYSCKQADYPIENASSYTKIFMPLANNGTVESSMAIRNEWKRLPLGAGCGGIELPDKDIEITFTIDEKSLEHYNQQNATNYTLPPAESYRFTDNSVIIPKGSTGSNTIYLEVNPLMLRGTKKYLIPVSITGNSAGLPVTEGLKTTYFLLSAFYEENPFEEYSQAKWIIHDYSDDDYDGIGGRAKYCIDGNINTCWLSKYRRDSNGWRPTHPHHVTINMNEEVTLHGVKIVGRLGANNAYLFPEDVFIETSTDGENWSAAGLFSIVASSEDNSATMYLEASVEARYFKFTVLRSKGGGDTTAIAEITAF